MPAGGEHFHTFKKNYNSKEPTLVNASTSCKITHAPRMNKQHTSVSPRLPPPSHVLTAVSKAYGPLGPQIPTVHAARRLVRPLGTYKALPECELLGESPDGSLACALSDLVLVSLGLLAPWSWKYLELRMAEHRNFGLSHLVCSSSTRTIARSTTQSASVSSLQPRASRSLIQKHAWSSREC